MRKSIAVLGAEVPSGRAIAKKLRAERYSCQLLSSDMSPAEVAGQAPAGIILAGEAQDGAAPPNVNILALGIPVLALGSSARALCAALGEDCEREKIHDSVAAVTYAPHSALFHDISAGERWIEQAECYEMPAPFRRLAQADDFPLAFGNDDGAVFLLQFRIERNDPDGMRMLTNFAGDVCGCEPWWTVDNIIEMAEETLRAAVADGVAICAMSGGLDSTVAAMLAKRALGERVQCVFVDTGLLRRGESEEAELHFREELGLSFSRVDAGAVVLEGLSGKTRWEDKWHVIEGTITRALLDAASSINGSKAFVKGTNYVDVLGVRHKHVLGDTGRVVEPLRELFKDEIRQVGEALSLSPAIINRQPFPGMGLAARIQGEVTAERLETLRTADAIFVDELQEAGLHKRLTRFFALLERVDGQDVIVLRAGQGVDPSLSVARLPYDLLERAVETIQKKLPAIRRVLYDMTPGMAEWRT